MMLRLCLLFVSLLTVTITTAVKAESYQLDVPAYNWHLSAGYAGYRTVGFDSTAGAQFTLGYRLDSSLELELTTGFVTLTDENYRQGVPAPSLILEGGEQTLVWSELMFSDSFLQGQWQFSKNTYINTGLFWQFGAGITHFSDEYYPTLVLGGGIRIPYDRYRLELAIKDHIFKFEKIGETSYGNNMQLVVALGISF
ncbi:hypothetical protein [Pelagibaculum spongiae]|uniref:Outer membrane protein beta-barrel domain-containing protein n=1 Tax=Pelagibaculum spongiae TaxID=2080658 RepID=A0A2V1GQ11_9GAMM|nr:hypothetical protein [Pelagibaculum spongiae]PVZ62985.1 hypothetical protein DC094_21705 [Pelagibaculum spongiae]